MPALRKARTSDQYNLEGRLEQLIHFHLLDMEENPQMYAAKDRLSAIQYIGMFLNRKYGWGEPEQEGVGSSVRKYARAAFQTPPHVAGGRTAGTRSAHIASRGLTSVPTDTSRGDTAGDPDEDAAA